MLISRLNKIEATLKKVKKCCECNDNTGFPFLPLRLVFEDILPLSNLVGDINSISAWNTFFDLPTNGNPFIGVSIVNNEVRLYGGSNIKVKPGLFYRVYENNNISLLEIDDQAKCITSVGGDAFSFCDNLTDVNLPECTIVYGYQDSPQGDYGGFGQCEALIKINMPKLVTTGDYVFYSCYSLTTIDFPALINAGEDTFDGCTSLTTVNLPNLTTAGYGCFLGCTSLATINLPNLTNAGDYCFVNCTLLTTVDLPNLTTAGNDCFNDCNNLSSISANNLTTAGDSCFYYCTSLLSLNLPNLTTAAYNCFNYCTSLTTINLPNLTTAGGYCFYECTALTTINLPSCTNLGTTTDYNYVFYNISGNTITLTVPSTLMTADSGNPDGDIQYLQANNIVTVITV